MTFGRYPKSVRLLKRRDFLFVQRRGTRASATSLTLVLKYTSVDRVRIGITVSRHVGGAVVRNLVKRRLKEIIRGQLEAFRGFELVVIAEPAAKDASFTTLRDDLAITFANAKSSLGDRRG